MRFVVCRGRRQTIVDKIKRISFATSLKLTARVHLFIQVSLVRTTVLYISSTLFKSQR